MANLNLELLRQRAQEIGEAQTALCDYVKAGREEFLQNRQVSDAAKYRLLLAVEACIGICNHLTARVARRAPASFLVTSHIPAPHEQTLRYYGRYSDGKGDGR